MGKIRRKFDIAFKTQVCQQIEAGVLRMTEFCHENQIQRTVVEGWLPRYVAWNGRTRSSRPRSAS